MVDKYSPIKGNVVSSLFSVLMAVLYPLTVVGMVAYFVQYTKSLITHESATSPIDLAAVAGTLGALILVGAFYKDKAETEEQLALGKRLKMIAKLLLGSAVSFIVTFLLLEALSMVKSASLSWAEWILVYATVVTIGAAGLTFCYGIVSLITVIRGL